MDIPTMLMQYQDMWFDCNAQSFSAVNLYIFKSKCSNYMEIWLSFGLLHKVGLLWLLFAVIYFWPYCLLILISQFIPTYTPLIPSLLFFHFGHFLSSLPTRERRREELRCLKPHLELFKKVWCVVKHRHSMLSYRVPLHFTISARCAGVHDSLYNQKCNWDSDMHAEGLTAYLMLLQLMVCIFQLYVWVKWHTCVYWQTISHWDVF